MINIRTIQRTASTTRKNQLFKWDLPKERNINYTNLLLKFFYSLGFSDEDIIECQLLHDTKGIFLQGSFPLSMLREQLLRSLHITCDTKHYKQVKKFIRTENENGFGIFFSTLGVRKGEEKKVRFHFVDVDFGKEIHYFQTEQELHYFTHSLDRSIYRSIKENYTQNQWRVVLYKTFDRIAEEKANYLKQFKTDLEHCLIVDTANGFHLYFPVSNGDYARFLPIQSALAKHFKGDLKVVDEARILRVPYTHHVKDPHHPYFVEVIQWTSSILLSQTDLIKRFNLSLDNTPPKTVQQPIKSSELRIKTKRDINIEPIIQTEQLTFAEFVEQVKKVPFSQLFENEAFQMEVGRTFNCLFHEDHSPSATVYQTDTGVFTYKCFSSNCKVSTFTVLDLVMEYYSLSFTEAVQYLSQLLGIKITHSAFQEEVMTVVHQNFQWIKQNLECRNPLLSEKPSIHTYLPVSAKHVLKELMVQLLSYPIKDEWSKQGAPIFFVSASYLATETRYSRKTVQYCIDLLVLLGFIEKLKVSDVPKSLFYRADQQQAVNYFVMYSLDEKAGEAERTIQLLETQKFKKTSISYEYLAISLGRDYAKRVYPNHSSYRKSQKHLEYVGDMKKETADILQYTETYVGEVIRKKGYIKDRFLGLHLEQNFSKKYPHLNEKVWQVIHKKVRALLNSLGYTRVKLTRDLANVYKLKRLKENNLAVYIWHKKPTT